MKRALPIPLLLFCSCLAVATAGLLLNPLQVSATGPGGHANCGNRMVYCYADICDCEDYVGCVGKDNNGRIVSTNYCSSADEDDRLGMLQ